MPSAEEASEMSEAQIAVHWKEEEKIHPSPKFVAQANLADQKSLERFSLENFPDFFEAYAELLDWSQRWQTTLDTSKAPFWKWFVGGKLNASYNCVDRHLAKYADKAAFIFVPELEDQPQIRMTYQDLFERVNEFASLLRDFAGVKAGDRVTFQLPMVPELPVSMLACARLGVVHSQVFGGFSGQARGYRAALDFLVGREEIDPDRVALWGDSASAGEVLVVSSVDPRVKAGGCSGACLRG